MSDLPNMLLKLVAVNLKRIITLRDKSKGKGDCHDVSRFSPLFRFTLR